MGNKESQPSSDRIRGVPWKIGQIRTVLGGGKFMWASLFDISPVIGWLLQAKDGSFISWLGMPRLEHPRSHCGVFQRASGRGDLLRSLQSAAQGKLRDLIFGGRASLQQARRGEEVELDAVAVGQNPWDPISG